MKNAMLRFGYTCALTLVASGLTMTAARAEQRDLATVNLSETVRVGSATLPSGHYTIVDEGNDVFLIRSENGDHGAMLLGKPVERTDEAPKTEVVLKNDGEGLRFDKLYIAGRTGGYDFE